MDLIIVAIAIVWVLTEFMMYLIQYGISIKIGSVNARFFSELDIDSHESVDISCSSRDCGINGATIEESEIKNLISKNEKHLIEFKKRQKRAMAKRLALQERDRTKIKEYLKSKKTLKSHEDGDETDSDASFIERFNLLYNFVQYIRKYKIISLQTMATEFKMRPQEIIEHIKDLQLSGIICGVLDDCGKFIFVLEKESKAVEKFIREQQQLSNWPQHAFL